jgi:hypothetical protein
MEPSHFNKILKYRIISAVDHNRSIFCSILRMEEHQCEARNFIHVFGFPIPRILYYHYYYYYYYFMIHTKNVLLLLVVNVVNRVHTTNYLGKIDTFFLPRTFCSESESFLLIHAPWQMA